MPAFHCNTNEKRVFYLKKLRRQNGPSDWVRTSGLVVPNHARYQLRHTRKLLFVLESLITIQSFNMLPYFE